MNNCAGFQKMARRLFLFHCDETVGFRSHQENLSTQEKFSNHFLQKNCIQCIRLPDDPKLSEVEHDLLFSVVLEFDGRDRVVCVAFHSDNFAKSELLMFYFLSDLQA